MKLTFLGGADEVGASCTLIELGGRRILVDCGIRMNPEDGDPLPYLAPISEHGPLDAIVLTHAHMDHLGAMPTLVSSFPNVPVYMTPSTLQLSSIMLADALKIMDYQYQELGIPPIYSEAAVQLFIGLSRCVPFGHTVELFDGDIRIQFNPAGHIIGAASVLFEADDGSILMTGDISVTDQVTIPGMLVPACKPDAVVIESTYGGRLHANRTAEEKRLIGQIGEVVKEGGSVLFPAFAIGRAQEIILILSKAMEQGKLKRVPIYVDGLVKQVCKVFTSHPHLLTKWLRKRLQKHGDPFFYEGGPAVPLWDPRKRDQVFDDGQAIIVSSSGMLTGGPSQLYARMLAANPKNFIAITGYQDEESPGRRIQELAKKGHGTLKLGDDFVELRCRVGTYSLSAHADTAQMVGVLAAVESRDVFLVHGDEGARNALQEAIERAGAGTVHQPFIGQTVEVKGHRGSFLKRRTQRTKSADNPEERPPLTPESLPKIASELVQRDGRSNAYTIQEILWAWGDIEGGLDQDRLHEISKLLSHRLSPFRQDRKRPYMYRIRTDNRGHVIVPGQGAQSPDGTPQPKAKSKSKKKASKDNPQAALQRSLDAIAKRFPPSTGLYGRKVQTATRTIQLSFPFPRIAQREHQAALEELSESLGWTLVIRDQPRQDALIQKVYEWVPDTWEPQGNPALHIQQERVSLKLGIVSPDPDEIQTVKDKFNQETGFKLDLKFEKEAVSFKRAKPGALPPTQQSGGVIVRRAPVEINSAFQTVRNAFQDQPHDLFKVGKKGNVLEVTFISPQIGERYRDLLDDLEKHIGWSITIRPNADQTKIRDIVLGLLPDSVRVVKGPSFRLDTHEVHIKIDRPLPRSKSHALRQEFFDACGWTVHVEVG